MENNKKANKGETVNVYRIPSRTSEKTYEVTKYSCECKGFEYRKDCAHVKAVRQAEENKNQYAKIN